MNINEIFIRRFIAVLMGVCVVVLMGAVSLSRLSVDLLPEMQLPTIMVITRYDGAGPREVENLVSRPVEEAVATVSGLQNIQSYSNSGVSVVIAGFRWGSHMSLAAMEVREKLDLIRPVLPDEASDPLTFTLDPSLIPIMQIGVEGDMGLRELTPMVEDVIRPRLERVKGVAVVETSGGITPEIVVQFSPGRIAAHNVTADNILRALFREHLNYRGGELTEGERVYLVRTMGLLSDISEIKDLVVGYSPAGPVTLGQVTEILEDNRHQDRFSSLNGKPIITLSVRKQSDANTVEVTAAVKAELARLSSELPGGLKFVTATDQSAFITRAIRHVSQIALVGGILAVMVIFLFLRSISATMVIASAIPISLLGTFSIMYFQGSTLNLITLGGLALGVGLMVDNSIVVLENIYRHRSLGLKRHEASLRGSGQMFAPVTAATLTTIVVFIPILFVEGITRIIFNPLAFTVSAALIVSLVVAMTWVPSLASRLPMEIMARRGLLDLFHRGFERVTMRYGDMLTWVLRFPLVIIGVVLILLAGSLLMWGSVGGEFLPEVDNSQVMVTVALPTGTSLEETRRFAGEAEKIMWQVPEVESIFASVGGGRAFGMESSSESAVLFATLTGRENRLRSGEQVVQDLRNRLSALPGARVSVFMSDIIGGNYLDTLMSGGVQLIVKGNDLDALKRYTADIALRLEQLPQIREVRTSFDEGRPEIRIRLTREKAALAGVNTPMVAALMETVLSGKMAARLEHEGQEIEVYLRGSEEYRKDSAILGQIPVQTLTGNRVSLGEIAEITFDTGPTTINRENQSRVGYVSARLNSGYNLADADRAVGEALRDFVLPAGFQLETGGETSDMMESFRYLGFALLLAVPLVYIIMAAQFESFLFPFIVMFTLPQTLIGVVAALLVTGHPLNVPSFIGVILLCGIVVNNGIILVDYINYLRREEGLGLQEALIRGGTVRLRPIMMTTATTILGMFPLALGLGSGTEIQAPMAVTVIGGLSFSTLLTLFLVPVMYMLLDRLGQRLSGDARKMRKVGGANRMIPGSE